MAKQPDGKCWAGFDLGATKMLAKIYDSSFKERGRKRKKTRAQEGKEVGLERIIETIRNALDDAGTEPEAVAGIGMGSPGPLDLNKGAILDTPNLGWANAPLKAALEKAFGCPAAILNDVDAGVYGEFRFGAARNARCAVGVFPGTGIGGGCVYEGRPIRGGVQSCMEIGHLPMQPDGPLCGCGNRGCLEAVASRLAISAAAAAAAFRGEAPHLLAAAGTDLTPIRSGTLAASVRAGDKSVERIVREAARWLGRGVAAAVNLLAPDIVVLGGGLVEAMPDLFREEVDDVSRRLVMPSFRKIYQVRIAELGDDATVLGAAAWAREQLEPKG